MTPAGVLSSQGKRKGAPVEKRLSIALESLRRERDWLDAVLENLSEGIVACDADGVLTVFNRATREFHGMPKGSIPAGEWADTYDLYLADGVTPMPKEEFPLFRALRGEDVREAEMVIAPKDRPARTFYVSASALSDAAGNTVGAVGVMNDVTERKEAEKQAVQRLVDDMAAAMRRQKAVELNDEVVQGLAIAKLAAENGLEDKVVDVITRTLEAARAIVTGLLRESVAAGDIKPGDLVRGEATTLPEDP